MICRVDFGYNGQEKLHDLAKSDSMYETLQAMLPDAPTPEHRGERWAWPRESLVDLGTDGRWLTENGVTFEVKKIKGTMPVSAILPSGQPMTVYVQVPHVGLLAVDEVEVEENCCTDRLQMLLDKGWRILCVCPPNAARRPDYILGRTRKDK